MPTTSSALDDVLVLDFLERHPKDAADEIERLEPAAAANLVAGVPPPILAKVLQRLSPVTSLEILESIDSDLAAKLLFELNPPQAGALLSGMKEAQRDQILGRLEPLRAKELRTLMDHPPETAGRLMDTRIAVFRPGSTAEEAIGRLRSIAHARRLFNLLVVDADGRLAGVVSLQEAVMAEPDETLGSLLSGPPVAVPAQATREEVVDLMERHKMATVPVIDFDGRPIGVIRLAELVDAVENVLSADLVSITGASKDERALSSAGFAVRKRLPWLQINLATAFLASSVVGAFEETISRFTALAVLLPVVAGQSGNTGAQALAVVLRGLALREITLRHWPKVVMKEFAAGLMNGLAVALVTCVAVYIWSRSVGLVMVIGIAMVFSMAIAGVAGAIIPVLLAAIGQDPAQSSSIVLTTVTDVFGFLSFLGLATAFASML